MSGTAGAGAMADVGQAPVFVFGCAWRCGSTLLQRYLNSTGEVFVWGENMGLVTSLAAAFDGVASWASLSAEQAAAHGDRGNSAWIANLNPPLRDAITATVREALGAYYAPATLERGVRRWGFKEVRYGALEADLLLRAFPDARVIFLVRDPAGVLDSMASASWFDRIGGVDGVVSQWITVCQSMQALRDPRVMTLRYEDLCGAPQRSTERLAAHLSLPVERFDARVLVTRVRGEQPPPRRTVLTMSPALKALLSLYYPEGANFEP